MTTHLFRPATHRGLTGHAGSPRGAELTHNDWDGGRTVSRAIALGDRSSRIIGRAIAAVSTDGTAAMGLSYSPDGQWIACDTAPRGPDHSSEVMLYEVTGNRKVSLGFYRSEEIFRGEIRCDLHPRWTPDGRDSPSMPSPKATASPSDRRLRRGGLTAAPPCPLTRQRPVARRPTNLQSCKNAPVVSLFDTIVFPEAIPCARCGASITSTQTHELGETLDTYRVGDVADAGALSTGILEERLFCEKCRNFEERIVGRGVRLTDVVKLARRKARLVTTIRDHE